MQLIRLQKQDTTAARLGMEAALTTQLNSLFGDTSYLNGLSASVRAALLPALSTKSAEAGTEFEFVA